MLLYRRHADIVFEWRVERGSLTQLGGLAKNKGVGPEFSDGGGVENVVTH